MVELIGGPGRDRTDDLFHAMEARSQLRHRPTDKLPLVYTSQADGSRDAQRHAKFRQRIILTAGLPPDAETGSIAARYAACALAIGMWGTADARISMESSE